MAVAGTGAGGWCHFTVRLPRSRRHRAAKGGDAGFEDERFSYLVVRRADRPTPPTNPAPARAIGSPRRRGGAVDLPLCTPSGAATVSIPARDREAHARARRTRWGDAVDLGEAAQRPPGSTEPTGAG